MTLKKNERLLFLSLWGGLLLAGAIWKFWPEAVRRHPALPVAQIESSLAGIFDGVSVDKSTNIDFLLTLHLGSDYRAKLSGQPRKVWLRYQLLGAKKTLYQGEVETLLDPTKSETQATLLNPLQVRPTQILIGAQ